MYSIEIFSHLKLCLATAIHNFKWLNNYLDVENSVTQYISFRDLKIFFSFKNWLQESTYILHCSLYVGKIKDDGY